MTVEVSSGQSGATAGAQGGASAGASTGQAASQASTTPQTGAATSGAPTDVASTPQAYTLNDKFKVMGVEKQFDPWIVSAIKDAETEKKVRELYEKAHGIDHVKADRKRVSDRLSDIEPKYTAQTERIGYLDELLNSGNIGVFQREVGITDDQWLRRAQQIIAARENPQLAQQENSSYESNQQMNALRQENRQLMQQQANLLRNELHQTLSSPEVASFTQQYDAKYGVGALAKRVIETGAYYQTTMKVSKSPLEIVQELMFPLGVPQAQPQQTAASAQNTPAPTAVTAPEKKPVIPNVGGKGTTPVKKASVNSIQDIRDRAKEFAAANA